MVGGSRVCGWENPQASPACATKISGECVLSWAMGGCQDLDLDGRGDVVLVALAEAGDGDDDDHGGENDEGGGDAAEVEAAFVARLGESVAERGAEWARENVGSPEEYAAGDF